MKNGLFGKILLLALAVIMLFALSSCGENETVEYDITGKSDFSVADTTFDGDVVIKGEGGSVTFENCVFNGNIINKGGEGARVILVEDCKFAEDSECIIESSLKEATLETDLPKFLIFCEAPSISCKNWALLSHFLKMRSNLTAKNTSSKMQNSIITTQQAKLFPSMDRKSIFTT